jgi:hypothetical protein
MCSGSDSNNLQINKRTNRDKRGHKEINFFSGVENFSTRRFKTSALQQHCYGALKTDSLTL